MTRPSFPSILAALSAVVIAVASAATAAAQPKVVVTIKPVHALVLEIMRGVAEPTLLVASSSPHTYAITPHAAVALNHASLFIRVSPTIEPFTEKLVAALPPSVEVVTLVDVPGLELLGMRRGPGFDRDASLLHAHAAGAIDGHVWLDPANARVMVAHIARVLSRADPAHAERFASNARALDVKLEALAAELAGVLEPVADRPYVVFHDAMQYFERRFRLSPVGSIAISPDIPPSGRRLLELKHRMKAAGVVCVFAEPQLPAGLVATVVEGTGARVGTLDPEAIALAPSADLYFRLMRGLAADVTRCLSTPV